MIVSCAKKPISLTITALATRRTVVWEYAEDNIAITSAQATTPPASTQGVSRAPGSGRRAQLPRGLPFLDLTLSCAISFLSCVAIGLMREERIENVPGEKTDRAIIQSKRFARQRRSANYRRNFKSVRDATTSCTPPLFGLAASVSSTVSL
jgi:hypothetical protein